MGAGLDARCRVQLRLSSNSRWLKSCNNFASAVSCVSPENDNVSCHRPSAKSSQRSTWRSSAASTYPYPALLPKPVTTATIITGKRSSP